MTISNFDSRLLEASRVSDDAKARHNVNYNTITRAGGHVHDGLFARAPLPSARGYPADAACILPRLLQSRALDGAARRR
eukprot:6184771-Pleurochrysis_carterae.AAC.2